MQGIDNFKKKIFPTALICFLLLAAFSTVLTQVQAAKPSAPFTLTSKNPVGGSEDYLGGQYGSTVTSGGGYFFVAAPYEGNTIYAYNAKTRALVATMSGSTVAVGGGYVVIGDPGYWALDSSSSGKVDIYSLHNLRRIVATITEPTDSYESFGSSIAISGSLLLVSDTGSSVQGWIGDVYVYSVPSFDYVATLAQENPTYAPDAPFGSSLAFCGSHIVVGAPKETVNTVAASGNVYLYSATTYEYESTIPNPDAAADSNTPTAGYFGVSIAVAGDNIWIGEPGYTYNAGTINEMWGVGRAYCYNTVSQAITTTLNTENPVYQGMFGYSIAANDNNVIVGSWGESVDVTSGTGITTLNSAGNAYVFDSSGTYVKTLYSLNPQTNGYFGRSVAIIPGYYLVGAPNEDVTMRYRSTTTTYLGAGQTYIFS